MAGNGAAATAIRPLHARLGAAGLADGHIAVHGRPDLRAVLEAHAVRVAVVPLLEHLAQLPRGLGDLSVRVAGNHGYVQLRTRP